MAPKKDLSLEGVRGLACLGVFLAHFIFSFLPYTAHWLTKGAKIPQFYAFETILCFPLVSVFINGSLTVSVFFVLSGYVITKKYFDTGDISALQTGAAKRYPRLAIPALVSVIFAWGLLRAGLMFNQTAPEIGTAGWPMASYPGPVGFGTALIEGLFSGPFLGRADLNNPLWTIQIELLGSLLLFAAYALLGTRRPAATVLLYMLLSMVISPSSINQIHFLSLWSGSGLHYVERHLRRTPALSGFLIAVGLILGAYDFSPWFDWARLPMPEFSAPMFNPVGSERFVFNAVGAFLLVGGVLGNRPVARAMSSRLPVYLGKISFSLYLLHWPIICSLSFGMMYLLKVRMGIDYLQALGATAVVTLSVTLIASGLLERFVDRPAIRAADSVARYIRGEPTRLPRSTLVKPASRPSP
jgi:peptidoglycan/LPS O-acetylase OafA/YrhL